MAATKMNFMNLGVFNGDGDFGLWRKRMRAVLIQSKLVKALKPDDLPATMKDEEKVELEEMAFSTILLYLGDKVLREVASETTTKGLWDKLERVYMTRSLNQRVHLKTRLYSLKMDEGSNLGEFLDQFNSIILDLSNIGIKIEDEDLAIILLSALPSSYSNFVETLRYSKDKLILEEVLASLKSKSFYDEKGVSRVQSEVFYVNKGREGEAKSKRVMECWHCHKEGHLRKDYPERKKKAKENK